MVHCQGGSNPPSPAPPLVLGTLLPHFISGKFSRLLAQTQGRISRPGVCVRGSVPTPGPGVAGRAPGRAEAGGAGGQRGAAPPGRRASPLRAAAAAPAGLPSQRPHSAQGPTTPAATLHPLPIAFAPRTPRGESEGTSAARVLPLCPPSCPGPRPEGLAGSSNLICFRSQATQIAFVRLKHSSWSSHLQPAAHGPQCSPYKRLVIGIEGKPRQVEAGSLPACRRWEGQGGKHLT